MSLYFMLACAMEDNSLEAAELSTADGSETLEVSGTLSVSAGEEEGDWVLSVGEAGWSYHSPSHADLLALDEAEVSATVQVGYSGTPGFLLEDDTGPRFVQSHDGGTSAFGRTVWTLGEVIGRGEIDTRIAGETQEVKFTDVVVETDDGEARILPGEPTRLTIDGQAWRVTVGAAYEAVNPRHAKCGASDMLAIELLRTEADPGGPLKRPEGKLAPVGGC